MRWRLATAADFERIEELSLAVQFEQGLHNWRLYFLTSPSTFYVFENDEDGQVVGYLSRNHMTSGRGEGDDLTKEDGVILNHHMVMEPAFRKRYAVQKLLRQLKQQWTGPVVSNVNAVGLRLLQSYTNDNALFYGPRFVGYYGSLPNVFPSYLLDAVNAVALGEKQNSVQLTLVTASNLEAVLRYDSAMHPYDRRKFMTQWLLPDGEPCSISLVAFSHGQVIGYGVVRKMTETYYDLAPLYADDQAVAKCLAVNLAYELWLQRGSAVELYLSAIESRTAFLGICQPLQLEIDYRETRLYEGKELALDWSKVYATHPFWLF